MIDLNTIGGPELSFEISECKSSLFEIINAIERLYPTYTFDRTEKRYGSCIMAIFVPR